MSEYKRVVFDLYLWSDICAAQPTNFRANLFSLLSKADKVNRERLAGAFPIEAKAFKNWQESSSETDFFKENGVEFE